eukprot:CAMPEP_0172308226 /NCGR_PEP_ID=MMETSP1058-20130122/8894_1 /TAXON_ID=83371 /ORGANISM="Detonula confervacea, Strain CCMP 353" /LENGTH=792 /DNA_ID=CAMNT_0013020599 /DNA_START=189 /DNA_END=2567 /DNA_ORIENTATION=-
MNDDHYDYPHPTPTLLMASTVATSAHDGILDESLNDLTVPQLKEKLRLTGQKLSGNKSELIQRLSIQQQSIIVSSEDDDNNDHDKTKNTIDHDHDDSSTIAQDESNLDPSLNQLPDPLREALIKYTASSISAATASDSTSISSASQQQHTTTPKLLPIQLKSYPIISKGNDAVLFSPTGTGKSLAFVLPLAARLLGWKNDGSLVPQKKAAQKARFMQQRRNTRNSANDSFLSTSSDLAPVDAASPSILIVEPSRELARQVGKVWGKFHPTAVKSSKRHVVAVYGGVPMARHAAMLSSKTDVVIGTPGRIRELIREKYLTTSHIRSIVLDEADTLLDFKDNPEVEWLLDGMTDDYQLVLASATVNKRVEEFVGEVMELEVGEEGYVIVEGDGGISTGADEDGEISIDGIQDSNPDGERDSAAANLSSNTPAVRHWSMPASIASRIALTSDLIVTMTPRRGIVFVPTKAGVETVAQELAERLSTANDVSIYILHGDMVQSARTRTVNSFRGDSARMTRILVATDVAARGLDLPAVDLVLQYGVPKEAGKDGTYDSELYIHRTGRAGRFGNTRTADAILLYDRSQGEVATLNKLQEEFKSVKGIDIQPRQLPSSSDVMEASYGRVLKLCEDFGRRDDAQQSGAGGGTQSLIQYFADKLSKDLISNDETFEDGTSNDKEQFLIQQLATAMTALSGLDSVVPPRSLLTADPRDRTIRVRNDSCDASNQLSPSVVTKLVKVLGSGKLGRITICDDGCSAVFDLTAKKAQRLLQNFASDEDVEGLDRSGWHFEMPDSLV